MYPLLFVQSFCNCLFFFTTCLSRSAKFILCLLLCFGNFEFGIVLFYFVCCFYIMTIDFGHAENSGRQILLASTGVYFNLF